MFHVRLYRRVRPNHLRQQIVRSASLDTGRRQSHRHVFQSDVLYIVILRMRCARQCGLGPDACLSP